MADLKSFVFAKWFRNPEQRRKWNCPDEQVLASYLDQTANSDASTRVERHLSSCSHCRVLVAESLKAQRPENFGRVPAALLTRVRSLGTPAPVHSRWSWLPLTVAPVGCAVLLFAWLRAPRTFEPPQWSAPSAPAIFKSPSAAPAIVPPSEVVRSSDKASSLPTLIFPAISSVIQSDRINFRWRAVPNASHYQVRILTEAGELLWQHDSAENQLQADDSLSLPAGRYYVLVSAIMENGRAQQSSPVEFKVTPER
jgi:Putative zinc-finger